MKIENDLEMQCEMTACPVCDSTSYQVTAEGFDYEYWSSGLKFRFVKCESCSHEFLNPRPSPKSIHKAYPDNYYTLEGRHTKKASKIISVMKRIVIRGRLKFFNHVLSGTASVLEIGCGDGSLLVDLKTSNPNLSATGIDMGFHQDMEVQCKALGINLIQGTIEDTVLETAAYDLVIMNQLVEHLHDPVSILGNVSDSLRQGGYVSIETPNSRGYDRRFFRKSFWGGYYFPRHLHLFSDTKLSEILNHAGLDVVKRQNLVAPIIWAFSLHALFCPKNEESVKHRIASWLFSDKNPLILGLFTIVDMAARIAGLPTSNQKIIAKKT